MRTLEPFFLVTDLGFLLYWLITGLHLLPTRYLYSGYADPLLVAWNGSFLPLDLCISASGLISLWLYRRNHPGGPPLAFASLVLTFCSGLQAVAFWAIRRDFEIGWWLPNLYLLIYPLFFVPRFLRGENGLTP